MASKIIVVGALRGRFAEAFPKLSALHTKNNFSFAVLLGDVFASSPTAADSLNVDRLLRREIAVPLPTYFTLGTSELPPQIVERIEQNSGEVCENLFFLGRKGSLNTAEGVRIVAVGGTWDPNLIAASSAANDAALLPFYTATDINPLKGQNYADILISTDWPAGIEKFSRGTPSGRQGKGSAPLADLARALRPRYHFSPAAETFWEREAYRNELRKGEGSEDSRISRFYGLGDWGNSAKAKAIFAFTINTKEPATAAASSTASPYQILDESRGTKRTADENNTFFWGDHTSPNQHQHKRHGGGARHLAPRPPPGPESCFFCLSYPQLEKHLIVSIGSESYLTTAKGPLTSAAINPPTLPFSSHILIIPFAHTPTLPLIDDPNTKRDTLAEMLRYKSALETMLAARAAAAVTFEIRRAGGVHAHWQVVPIKAELADGVDAAFDDGAHQALGRVFEDDDGEEEGDAFRYWVSGREKGRMLRLEGNEYFDLQFGRRVLAGVVGTRGVNWRDCVLSAKEEAEDARAFKEAFKPVDFSLEE